MIRLWEILSRTSPLVAPADALGQPFGFTAEVEREGWTVTAYGSDGRRLGRQLKGLSESAKLTLTRSPDHVVNASDLQRLADAWAQACKRNSTNADVLTAFADAATPRDDAEEASPGEAREANDPTGGDRRRVDA